MFGLPVLDVGIGLLFLYLIFSLVCSAVREMLAAVTNARMRTLSNAITNLLGQKADEFYAHGLIQSLHENGRKPTFIPSSKFSLTVLEILAPTADDAPRDFAAIRTALLKIQNIPLKQSMIALADASENDLPTFRRNIESWFEDSMVRASSWYRRKTQWVLFLIALAIATIANVDTIAISNTLSQDGTMREALVAQATAYVKANPNGPPQSLQETIESARQRGRLGIALGWRAQSLSDLPAQFGWLKIAGLLLSAFAFSLGAPFWFDTLNKVVTIRSSGERK